MEDEKSESKIKKEEFCEAKQSAKHQGTPEARDSFKPAEEWLIVWLGWLLTHFYIIAFLRLKEYT